MAKTKRVVCEEQFKHWTGASDRALYLTEDELNTIKSEDRKENCWCFDEDDIAEWLGYGSFDEFIERDEETEDNEHERMEV